MDGNGAPIPDPRWRIHLLGDVIGLILLPTGGLTAKTHPHRVKRGRERSLAPRPRSPSGIPDFMCVH